MALEKKGMGWGLVALFFGIFMWFDFHCDFPFFENQANFLKLVAFNEYH